MAAWVVPVVSAVASAAATIFGKKDSGGGGTTDPTKNMTTEQKAAYYAALSGDKGLTGTAGISPESGTAATPTTLTGKVVTFVKASWMWILGVILAFFAFKMIFGKKKRPARRRRSVSVSRPARRRRSSGRKSVSKAEFLRRMAKGRAKAKRNRKRAKK